jgi:protein-L-isoaspartate(D-aspartate) O-methyltransferase
MDEQQLDHARERMVQTQLVARSIAAPAVLNALRRVPRHAFVPRKLIDLAYEDRPLDIGLGQTISQPYMVALMTERLAVRAGDRVLEVGTGSGYQAAILAEIGAEVLTLERHPRLAERARKRLATVGFENVDVRVGDGSLGAPEDAPFDAILVTAGGPNLPPSLLRQLADGARMVCPVGTRRVQHLIKAERHGKKYTQERQTACVFVPLVGQEGWSATADG